MLAFLAFKCAARLRWLCGSRRYSKETSLTTLVTSALPVSKADALSGLHAAAKSDASSLRPITSTPSSFGYRSMPG